MPANATNAPRSPLKSPNELALLLARHWQDAGKREQFLLHSEAWPMLVPIGLPTAKEFTHETSRVRAHVEDWRAVSIGDVITETVRFRSGAEPVIVPTHWSLASAVEWADASNDTSVQAEQAELGQLLEAIPPLFHRLLIRQRSLWRTRPRDEVVQAATLALGLEPGVAAGRPMRSISVAGIDSKFMERHGALVTALLDVRFEGQASKQGLVRFLDAADEGEHWLLVVPLSPGLLPFARQRVRARELMEVPLPARRILVVENDRCLHLLPPMPDTIAVLGAGLNLAWLDVSWLRDRDIGYWGDLDTWGLQMLALARRLQPEIEPILMNRAVFEAHGPDLAVCEDTPALPDPPNGLSQEEQTLYCYLRGLQKGRLEQEFLPAAEVANALAQWRCSAG
jgi:hypothetical protein